MAFSRADQIRHARPEGDVFGHPRGLTFLFATEMWERFAYYGMQALLALYLVRYLLLSDRADQVIGLGALKKALEASFGPLGVQAFASHIYGLHTALAYLTPIIGGLLADRVLGQRRMVIVGATLMAIGHFMMAFESLFLIALTTLSVANGALRPNIVAQVGSLYAAADPRRDRAYTIFYVGFKIGAFLAPLVCGTLAEEWGWHYGFAAAGAGMAIGLAVYLYAGSALPPDEMDKIPAPLLRERQEAAWQSILALSVLFIPAALFWAAYQQRGNTIALWADDYTDRTINLLIWHGEIPVAWFQAFNPLLLFAFAPVVIGLWSRQARRGSEPSTIAKMALGAVCVALAYLVMAGAAWSAAGDEASWWWLAAFFALLTVGELYFAPISFSLVSKAVPGRMLSTTMGLWLATSFAGSLLSGWLGSFWSDMNKASFFLMLSGVAAFAGLLIYAFKRPLRSMLGD